MSTSRAALGALAVLVAAGCMQRGRERYVMVRSRPDPWPTRVVVVDRDGSQMLGLEVERAEGGRLVEVRLHDGRHLWVRASAVHAETLGAGELVAMRWNGETAMRIARIVERQGDVLVVEMIDARGGGRAIVSLADVVARVAQAPAGTQSTPQETPPPPPVDVARQVSWPQGDAWAPATLTSCGASLRVAYADGATEEVRPSDLSELRLAVGERVGAFSGSYSFPARVEAIQGTVARVRFEDGSDQWLEIVQVRWVERASRTSEPTARPRWLDGACRQAGQSADGPRVLARRWIVRSAGAITECSGGRAVVVGRDGGRSEVAASSVSLLAPQVGDAARVRWRGSAVYQASVDRVDGAQLGIRWEDGSNDTAALDTVVSHLVPARRADPPRAPPACGGPPLAGGQPTRIIQDFPGN